MKEHFEIKDNVVDKNLIEFLKSQSFASRTELHYLIDDLLSFFAEKFSNGDKEAATKLLEQHSSEHHVKTSTTVTIIGGSALVTLIACTFEAVTLNSNQILQKHRMIDYLPMIRLSMIFIYCLFAVGFSI